MPTYQLGFENKWAGVIDKLYLQHDIFNATPIIPSGIRYQTMYSGERDQVLVLNNVDVQNDRASLFAIAKTCSLAETTRLVEEKVHHPAPVTNVTASSWDKAPVRLDNRNYVVTCETSLTDTLQAYQTGNPTDLDLFSKGLQRKMCSSIC